MVGQTLQFRLNSQIQIHIHIHIYIHIHIHNIYRCQVNARPLAHQVDWFLNGKPLSSELVSGNILSLTSEPDLSDAVLSCRAENKAGSTTSSRIIIVKGTKYGGL